VKSGSCIVLDVGLMELKILVEGTNIVNCWTDSF